MLLGSKPEPAADAIETWGTLILAHCFLISLRGGQRGPCCDPRTDFAYGLTIGDMCGVLLVNSSCPGGEEASTPLRRGIAATSPRR
jgi:hypothetical protein